MRAKSVITFSACFRNDETAEVFGRFFRDGKFQPMKRGGKRAN
jgi:hypothetical protein